MELKTPLLRVKISSCLKQVLDKLQVEYNCEIPATVQLAIEHPQDPAHGDFATGISLKLARILKTSPMDIAEKIVNHMPALPEISTITVASPGFINFTVKNTWLSAQVESILALGQSYANVNIGENRSIQVEFVSVNPTGPLHVGHGRGAVLGSTIANILDAAGYSVEKEYYLNDTGNQIATFGHSLYTRYCNQLGKKGDLPTNGYFGNYINDLARSIIDTQGDCFINLASQDAILQLGQIGTSLIIEGIKQDLNNINVSFDSWFSEKSLYQNGEYNRTMSLLEQSGYIVKKDNATWFESSSLGEDKDNVLVRSDGVPTYFASDIAYHYNKFFIRNFDTVIDVWGADHQGHLPRMKAAMKALGKDPENLKVVICQLVTLRRGNEIVRLSKRSGDIVTLRELVDEVGLDACRFFFLSRSANSQMDFDIALAKEQSDNNPVYYVQYAHARIASILRLAHQRSIDFSQGDVSLLTTESESALIRKLTLIPEIIEHIAETLEPHHLPYYTQELATTFHSFYKQCRVISDNDDLTRARLKLVKATQIILARSLSLMGMKAPEKM